MLRPILRRPFQTSARLSTLSAVALEKAQSLSSAWKGTSATGGATKNFIGGEFLDSQTFKWHEVLDPVWRRRSW
jgi:malonate-semialdehyde dehydrogenase (acetylating)/methylmalonate-semialdehyde dehydrogenase